MSWSSSSFVIEGEEHRGGRAVRLKSVTVYHTINCKAPSSEPFYNKAMHVMAVVTKDNGVREHPKEYELITRKSSRNCSHRCEDEFREFNKTAT